MSAQSTRLATVADNIANSGTNGYKRAAVEFSSLVVPNTGTTYVSGGVSTSIRYDITSEGGLNYTTSATDLAIRGNGFFAVTDAAGSPSLTRAGSFVRDSSGHLINAAGFRLMGYDVAGGLPSGGGGAGYDGLTPVQLQAASMSAAASTQGTVAVNLPFDAPKVAVVTSSPTPASNAAASVYHERASFSHEGPTGGLVGDVYFTKVGSDTWEVTVFARHPAVPAGFPYTLPFPDLTATTTVTLDPVTGSIVSGQSLLTIYPDGEPLEIDLSGLSQLATPLAASGFRPKMNLATNHPVLDTSGGARAPSANEPASVYYIKQQMTGYTGLGSPIAVESYYVKTGPDTWEVSVFNSADATAGGFPYGAAGTPPIATASLVFDPATGALISGSPMLIPLGGGDNFEIDYTQMVALDNNHPDWWNALGTVGVTLNLSPTQAPLLPTGSGTTPADNLLNSVYSAKTSIRAYDFVGSAVLVDVYFSKIDDAAWEVTLFNHADASAGTGFPYGSAGSAPLATGLVQFDPVSGKVVSGGAMTFTVPNGAPVDLDLSGMSHLASEFSVFELSVNGTGPSNTSGYVIAEDGTVFATYGNGEQEARYKLALGTVQSPDQMSSLPGNVFKPSRESGEVQIGFATEGIFGRVISGALENSNVDIAEELTSMIESQRNYTANSKVFQTGSDLMETLVNLKR